MGSTGHNIMITIFVVAIATVVAGITYRVATIYPKTKAAITWTVICLSGMAGHVAYERTIGANVPVGEPGSLLTEQTERRETIPPAVHTNTYDTLFLTARSREDVPEYVFRRFEKFAQGFHIKFYNDDEALESIKGFGETVLQVFQSLTGPHRADLWRYCMLFKYGGVYADIKTVFTRQLRSILDDRYCYTVMNQASLSSTHPNGIHQGFLACKKNSPVMHDVIVNVLEDWKKTQDQYDYFLLQFYKVLSKRGTVNVGANDSGWYLWQEKEDASLGTVRDRYGFLPLAFCDVDGQVMMI